MFASDDALKDNGVDTSMVGHEYSNNIGSSSASVELDDVTHVLEEVSEICYLVFPCFEYYF